MDNMTIIKNIIEEIINNICDETINDEILFNSDNDYKISEEEINNVPNDFNETQYNKIAEILNKLGFKVDKNKLKNIK